jgi:hypothetical protein
VLDLSKCVTLVLVAVLLGAVVCAQAQFGVPLNRSEPRLESASARELVERYCRMDYAGARLNPTDWPKLQPMVSWRSNPEFPLMMITSRFDVDSDPLLEHGKYLVIVHYRLLGKYDMAEGYSKEPANSIQNVQFVVSEVNGEWRITGAEPSYPYVSRSAVLQWLNKKLVDTQDPATKTIYQQAVQDLQPQNSSPSAR